MCVCVSRERLLANNKYICHFMKFNYITRAGWNGICIVGANVEYVIRSIIQNGLQHSPENIGQNTHFYDSLGCVCVCWWKRGREREDFNMALCSTLRSFLFARLDSGIFKLTHVAHIKLSGKFRFAKCVQRCIAYRTSLYGVVCLCWFYLQIEEGRNNEKVYSILCPTGEIA